MNKIDFNLKEKCGIYMFFNMKSGKRYVGSSVDIYNRIHEHVHNLNNNKAHNAHFQNSWNKHGEEAFIFCVLEYCEPEIRFEREQYYIDYLKPEYNLTLNVVANFGHSPSQETRNKISTTLKEKYNSGKITTYKQEHLWETVYVYNIHTFTLEAICKCKADALRLINYKSTHFDENRIYCNKYCLTTKRFDTKYEIVNYVGENLLKANSSKGMYMITEDVKGNLKYHLNLPACAEYTQSSKSTLGKQSKATRSNPYLIKQSNFKFYYSNEYIPINIDKAVPIEKSLELSSGNIGETPEMGNSEINSEIKNSESSYSVDIEPLN